MISILIIRRYSSVSGVMCVYIYIYISIETLPCYFLRERNINQVIRRHDSVSGRDFQL